MAEVESATGRWRYELSVRVAAPIEEVWELVGRAERWKEWSFLSRSLLLRDGSPDPDGVGALRRFAVGAFGSTEEVVVFEPPSHLAYIGVKGLPVRSYRADVVLEADGGGTRVTWSGKIEPKIPGSGGLALAFVRTSVKRFMRQLTAYLAKRAG